MSTQQNKSIIIGWDIGGAHIKAAKINNATQLEQIWLEPCPLWKNLDYLHQSIAKITQEIPKSELDNACHAITMTGEMTDLFESRSAGVSALIKALGQIFKQEQLFFYSTDRHKNWPTSQQALTQSRQIASANWHATASLAARYQSEAILIDIGSTTTDLIPIHNGYPSTLGMDDKTRLATGELVYTGVARTPLMAITNKAPVQGHFLPVMAEHFATSADVYRILSLLPEEADLYESADGKAKHRKASQIRLARMLGYDEEEQESADWLTLAAWFSEKQLDQITHALYQILSRNDVSKNIPFVTAGIGAFLGERLASRRADQNTFTFSSLFSTEHLVTDTHLTDWCAPAVATAMLFAQDKL